MVISELHNSVYSSRRNQKNLNSGRTDLMTPQNSSWYPRQEKCNKEAESWDLKETKRGDCREAWGRVSHMCSEKLPGVTVTWRPSTPSQSLPLFWDSVLNSPIIHSLSPWELLYSQRQSTTVLCSFYIQVVGETPSELQSLPLLLQDAAGEGDRVDAGFRQLDSDPTMATHQSCDLGQGLSKAVSLSAEGTWLHLFLWIGV